MKIRNDRTDYRAVIRALGLNRTMPRRVHNRRFRHYFLVTAEVQHRVCRQILEARAGGLYSGSEDTSTRPSSEEDRKER